MQWTDEDPGAGDMSGLEEYVTWISVRITEWDFTAGELRKAQGAIPGYWTGVAAQAAQLALTANITAATESEETLQTAKTAIKTYIDAVNEIKNQARKLIEDRGEALLAVNKQYTDSSSHPPSDDEVAQRAKERATAQQSLSDAEAGLRNLADERQTADTALERGVLTEVSSNWAYYDGGGKGDPYWQKQYANATVIQMLRDFFSGKGPRDRFFLDGHPFLERLKDSEFLKSKYNGIKEQLLDGRLVAGQTGLGDRSVSGDAGTFVGDGFNGASVGQFGNLPESFLGSYSLSYTVDSIDSAGNAKVTFTIYNETTRESFARNPLPFGGDYLPYKDDIDEANKENGMYDNMDQTIIWTESFPTR